MGDPRAEDYVPLLSASAVSRSHGAAGSLAGWLMVWGGAN